MVKRVEIGGESFKMRNPFAVLGLSLITLGIYYYYWVYQIRKEASLYLGDRTISPGAAVLALTLGRFVFIPPFVAEYTTADYVRDMQRTAGVDDVIYPWAVVVVTLFFFIGTGPYIQQSINKVWRRHESGEAPDVLGGWARVSMTDGKVVTLTESLPTIDSARGGELVEKAQRIGLSDTESDELGRLLAEKEGKPYSNAKLSKLPPGERGADVPAEGHAASAGQDHPAS